MLDLSTINKTGILKINIKKEGQYFLNFLSNNKYEITDKNKKQNIKGK